MNICSAVNGLVTHVSIEETVHDEDHNSLECCEDAENPLNNESNGGIPYHKEPQCPSDAQDGDQDKRSVEEGAMGVLCGGYNHQGGLPYKDFVLRAFP